MGSRRRKAGKPQRHCGQEVAASNGGGVGTGGRRLVGSQRRCGGPRALSIVAAKDDRNAIPLFEPRPGGPAERFDGLVGERHPVVAFFLALVSGYLLLAAASIAPGLPRHEGPASRSTASSGRRAPPALVRGRARPDGWTDASWVGIGARRRLRDPRGDRARRRRDGRPAQVADRRVRPLRRRRRVGDVPRDDAASSNRDRPDVERLESLPVDASYPSGHTAASIALYSGFALLAHVADDARPWRRSLVWAVALAIPPIVALLADVPRDAPPDRHARRRLLMGIAALAASSLLRAPRRGRGRSRGATEATESRDDTRSRSSRTPARPSAAGCSSSGASSSVRASRTRSGTRCRRAARRRSRSSGRSRTARSSSSSGAATGRCSGASTRSPGPRSPLAIVPAGTANLLASNLGIPNGHRAGGATSGCTARRRTLDVGRMNGERFARHGRRRLRRAR